MKTCSAEDMAGLIASRICHDLISPLGAIGNGVELLELTGKAAGAEIGLIGQSAAAASARLQFYRIALGQAGGNRVISGRDLTLVLAAASRNGRLRLDWPEPESLTASMARLLLLGVMCLESALPHGGNVTLRRKGGGWSLTAEAARILPLTELWAAMEAIDGSDARPRQGGLLDDGSGEGGPDGDRPPISAAHLQFALAPLRAREMGMALTPVLAPGTLTLVVSPIAAEAARPV